MEETRIAEIALYVEMLITPATHIEARSDLTRRSLNWSKGMAGCNPQCYPWSRKLLSKHLPLLFREHGLQGHIIHGNLARDCWLCPHQAGHILTNSIANKWLLQKQLLFQYLLASEGLSRII